ncbi:unnamed protein product [Ectocarpus sp. 8 AP-2014]
MSGFRRPRLRFTRMDRKLVIILTFGDTGFHQRRRHLLFRVCFRGQSWSEPTDSSSGSSPEETEASRAERGAINLIEMEVVETDGGRAVEGGDAAGGDVGCIRAPPALSMRLVPNTLRRFALGDVSAWSGENPARSVPAL